MRSTLFEIQNLSALHAILIAAVFGGLAMFWLRREVRLGRMEQSEYRQSIYWVIGVAAIIGVGIWAASRWLSPIKIRAYGVMLMLAFVVGIIVAMKRAPRFNVEPIYIIDFALLMLAGSILGSRILYIALNWEAEYAGLVGGLIFTHWRKIRPAPMADLITPSVALGYAVARFGCFLNGCCHGGPTTVAWAVDFPGDNLGAVHPVQLYALLGSLALGIFLIAITPLIRVPGHLSMWYLVLYSGLRSGMEHFRRGFTAEPWELVPALTQAQAFSILVAAVAIVVLVVTWKRVGYPLPEPDEAPAGDSVTYADKPKNRKKRKTKKR